MISLGDINAKHFDGVREVSFATVGRDGYGTLIYACGNGFVGGNGYPERATGFSAKILCAVTQNVKYLFVGFVIAYRFQERELNELSGENGVVVSNKIGCGSCENNVTAADDEVNARVDKVILEERGSHGCGSH